MNFDLVRQSIQGAAEASFSRSGGPGGQNVNKVNTKVTLRLRLDDVCGLNDTEKERLRATLASRVTGEGEIVIASDEERSRHTNLKRAYARMEGLIEGAARLPTRRRPTRPSRAAREERLQSKHRLGAKKTERRFKPEE